MATIDFSNGTIVPPSWLNDVDALTYQSNPPGGAAAWMAALGALSLSGAAASGGSALIGYTRSESGAVARTVENKLRESVSVFDFMSTAQIADVVNNTATIDVSAAVNLAINSVGVGGGGRLLFPAGTYRLDSQLVFAARRWVVEGAGTLLTRLLWNGATNTQAVKFTSSGGTGNTYFAIKNLSVINNVAVGTTQGILLTSAASGSNSGQAVVEQVLCNGFADGLAIGEAGGNASSEITLINYTGTNNTNGVNVQAANSLNIQAINVGLSGNSIGWLATGTHTQYIYGGSASANTAVDFSFTSAGVYGIQNFRSENGVRFLRFASTSAFSSINLFSNIVTGANLAADNAEVQIQNGNFFLTASANQFRGNFDNTGAGSEGVYVMLANATQQATLLTTNGNCTYRQLGNYRVGATGLFVSYFADKFGSQRAGVASDTMAITWIAGIPSVGFGVPIAVPAPVTETAATRTVLLTDASIICNRAGTITLTLPSAATYPGRILNVRTITANAVVSASSNVVPLVGGAAGTAILAATAGRWAELRSDGANWQIVAGN